MSELKAGLLKVDLGDDLSWGKSSRSGGNGGDCVAVTTDDSGQVALVDGRVGFADTKEGPNGTRLWLLPSEFKALYKFAAQGRSSSTPA
jgi:hypothetical protein